MHCSTIRFNNNNNNNMSVESVDFNQFHFAILKIDKDCHIQHKIFKMQYQ